AIGGLGDGKIDGKVYGFVLKCGDVFDSYICNLVMDMYMYGELGHSEDARKVFDEMGARDLVSWNVLISVYVKCKRFEDAVSVYVRMRKDRIRADEATLASTLSACVGLRDV
nr:pentatricopeptide repeat-containing protein At1g31430 [Tanacetum cinerariifolium]